MSEQDLIPFGKYKGQPVEVMQSDSQYVDWLMMQSWFSDKFPKIYNVVINHHGEPTETPEHNAMQAKFFDDSFCMGVVASLFYTQITNRAKWVLDKFGAKPSYLEIGEIKQSAEVNGLDICLKVSGDFDCDLKGDEIDNWWSSGDILFELKPTMSDDYPSVLRQIKKSKHIHRSYGDYYILVVGEYTGVGADWETVKKIFAADNIDCLLMSEIKPMDGNKIMLIDDEI